MKYSSVLILGTLYVFVFENDKNLQKDNSSVLHDIDRNLVNLIKNPKKFF